MTHSLTSQSKISRAALKPLNNSQFIQTYHHNCIVVHPTPAGVRNVRLSQEYLRRQQVIINRIRLIKTLTLLIAMISVALLMLAFLEGNIARNGRTRIYGASGKYGNGTNYTLV